MSCSQCDHCRALAERAVLHISARPRAGNAGLNVEFYRNFAAVYDLAVSRYRQPMKAIREANPDLSIHQCRGYLKRARALDLVRTPPATGAPVGVRLAVEESAADAAQGDVKPVSDTTVDRVLADPYIQKVLAAGAHLDSTIMRTAAPQLSEDRAGVIAAAVRARLKATKSTPTADLEDLEPATV